MSHVCSYTLTHGASEQLAVCLFAFARMHALSGAFNDSCAEPLQLRRLLEVRTHQLRALLHTNLALISTSHCHRIATTTTLL